MSFEKVSVALAALLRGFNVEHLAYDPRWKEKAWSLKWDGRKVLLLRNSSDGIGCPVSSGRDWQFRRQHVDAWLYRGDAVRELIEAYEAENAYSSLPKDLREHIIYTPASSRSVSLSTLFDRDALTQKLREVAGSYSWRLAHDASTGPARASLVLSQDGEILFASTGDGIFCDIDMHDVGDDQSLEEVIDGWFVREAADQFLVHYASSIKRLTAQYLSSESATAALPVCD